MYRFDIDITPSLNGKEIHLAGICEMISSDTFKVTIKVNPAKRNVLDLKNETCKNREKRNVLKISHTRHFKAIKKQSVLGCFYGF